jgi:hypothetical protein
MNDPQLTINETPRRRATRYQHGNKLFTRRKRRGIHPEYPAPVPFPTRREGVQGLGTLKKGCPVGAALFKEKLLYYSTIILCV